MSDWYSTDEALGTIQRFHENCAGHPVEMTEAKQRHKEIMKELLDYLKNKKGIVKRPEYTGSAYERLKVAGQLEFDVMFILNDGELLEVQQRSSWSNFNHLSPKNPTAHEKFRKFLVGEKICPLKVRNWFHGEVQKWLNLREASNPGEITLHYNGPATMATVFRNGHEWYDVDLVPAFEIPQQGQRNLYVAKPKDMADRLWRRSYSLQEKKKLKDIDGTENGCRKKIIRIIKVVRDKEPGMQKMVSFYIKCKIMEMDEANPFLNWTERNLAQRLRDVMLELSKSLEIGYQNHPFDDTVNILGDLSLITRSNIADRLKRIVSSETVARKVFNSPVYRDDSSDEDDDYRAVHPYSRGNLVQQEDSDNLAGIGFGTAAAAVGIGLLAFGAYKYMQSNKKSNN